MVEGKEEIPLLALRRGEFHNFNTVERALVKKEGKLVQEEREIFGA